MRIDMNFAHDIIRCIDRITTENGNLSALPETFLAQPELKDYQYSSDALYKYLDYCNEQGYFYKFKRYTAGFSIRDISQKGYDFLDQKKSTAMPDHTTNFNFNNATFNNSPIGENVTQSVVHGSTYGDNAFIDQSVTNNIGASIQRIERLISAKSAADQEQLAGLTELLRAASAKDAPVQKGLLSKFSDGIKKHSDLIVAIGNWAVAVLTSGQ